MRYLNYFFQDKWFNSKWLAIEHALSSGFTEANLYNHLRCVLNKDFGFDNFNWLIEPKETWEELCVERALYLRESHDWLALSYSGGSDSHHILSIFTDNNIKLDQIIVYRVNLKGFDNKFNNYEIDNIALPNIYKLGLQDKLTIIENDSWIDTKNLLTDENIINSGRGLMQSAFCLVQCKVYKYLSSKGILINGSTEPHVHLDHNNNKYYADIWDTDNFLNSMSGDDDNCTVPFYTDPSFPKLHAKQCHIMKNFFREKRHIDIDNEFNQYKIKMAALLRGGYIFPKSPFLWKFTTNPVFKTKKSFELAKHLATQQKEIFDRYTYTLNRTINGKKLINFPTGTHIGKFYLE